MHTKTSTTRSILYLLFIALFALILSFLATEPVYAAEKNINNCEITLSQTSFLYSGSAISPTITIKDGETILKEGTDYILYGTSAYTVGEHTIDILGKGNYTGQTSVTFQIIKAPNTITLLEDTFYTYSNPDFYYLDFKLEQNAPLTFSTNTSSASISSSSSSSRGELDLADGFLGNITVNVNAKETSTHLAASAVFTLHIKLKNTEITNIRNISSNKLPAANDHTAYVTWNVNDWNIQSVDGFQIRYSSDPTFTSNVYKTKIPMLNFLGIIVNCCSVSSHLSKGDLAYFQIRTYKKALDGKTYYSAWSDTVSHKIDSSKNCTTQSKSPYNNQIYTVKGIDYKYKNKKLTAVGTRKLFSLKQIRIPATVKIYGKKYPVTAVKANAFQNTTSNRSIQKIIIGKNVKKIGNNAFSGNRSVKTIEINSKELTGKSIGKNAFKNVGTFNRSIKLKVPDTKKAAYKKLLKKAGLKRMILSS